MFDLFTLSVYFSKHNIKCSNDGHDISQHVVLADVIGESEVEESRSLDLASVWSGASIRDKVDSKLSLGSFNGCVCCTSRNLRCLKVENEEDTKLY